MLLTRDVGDTAADAGRGDLTSPSGSLFTSLPSLSFLFVFYNSKVKAGCEVSVVNGHEAAVRVMSLPPVLLEHKVDKPGDEGGDGGGREKEDRVRMCGSPLRGRRSDGTAAALSCT